MPLQVTVMGEVNPCLTVTLAEGEMLNAQAGCLVYMAGPIDMNVETKAGVLAGVRRKLASQHVTTFVAGHGGGLVGLAAPWPGRIHELTLAGGSEMVVERSSYLASTDHVDVEVGERHRLGAGWLGGEGVQMMRLAGAGSAWLHVGGDVIEFELPDGQWIRADYACVVAASATATLDHQKVAGFRKSLWSGEQQWTTRVTGPGVVVLQTLPYPRLAQAMAASSKSGA